MNAAPTQLAFDALGTPLRDTTFVVFDLETTGGRAEDDAITEIGAVKVRGGEVIGEFATLVDPERGIPLEIVRLTGITDAMAGAAPKLAAVLPSFLEFVAGAVLVAHNSAFDIGFMKAACRKHGYAWPSAAGRLHGPARPPRADQATRRPAVDSRRSPRCSGPTPRPTHRALDDARATVEVLHALLERVGSLGVQSLEELLDYLPEVTPQQRRKRTLAQHLPEEPGVYLFRGPSEEVLYVGTSRNLRRRVRQYFTGSETRGRIREMVALAVRVDSVTCAHSLEAEVRELRLLVAHRPAYNRRSLNPSHAWWVVLTDEPFPRLSVVRTARDGALGPFRTRRLADDAVLALQEATGLRPCTVRISARAPSAQPCALAEIDRCAAPCAGRQSADQYAPAVNTTVDLVAGATVDPLGLLTDRLRQLAREERFEQAAADRDRMRALVRGLDRGQRMAGLAALAQLVAARPDEAGGWQFAVVRHGRLASAGVAPRGTPPMPVVDALVAAAETVLPQPGPLRGAPPEEVGVVLRWLDRPGTRLVHCSQPWSMPVGSAARWREWLDTADSARTGVTAHLGS